MVKKANDKVLIDNLRSEFLRICVTNSYIKTKFICVAALTGIDRMRYKKQ